jgi:hypothetical protein
MMNEREGAVMGWMMLVLWLVVVTLWCLLPPRYSDGRLADVVAREMYDAGLDEPLIGGDR